MRAVWLLFVAGCSSNSAPADPFALGACDQASWTLPAEPTPIACEEGCAMRPAAMGGAVCTKTTGADGIGAPCVATFERDGRTGCCIAEHSDAGVPGDGGFEVHYFACVDAGQ